MSGNPFAAPLESQEPAREITATLGELLTVPPDFVLPERCVATNETEGLRRVIHCEKIHRSFRMPVKRTVTYFVSRRKYGKQKRNYVVFGALVAVLGVGCLLFSLERSVTPFISASTAIVITGLAIAMQRPRFIVLTLAGRGLHVLGCCPEFIASCRKDGWPSL